MAIPVIHSLATQYAQHQIMVLSIDTFSPLFENVPDNVIFRGADYKNLGHNSCFIECTNLCKVF